MTRIVTTTCRYKPPPRKRKPVAIEVPEVVTIPDRKRRKTVTRIEVADEPVAAPAHDDRKSVMAQKPAIVTARRPGKRIADVPDMTPEEHRRRGEAAAALWRQIISGKEL